VIVEKTGLRDVLVVRSPVYTDARGRIGASASAHRRASC
jgi:hypothetical protein